MTTNPTGTATEIHVLGFDVDVVLPLSTHMRRRVTVESEALRLAQEWVGPNQNQITITAWTDAVGTFAVRHITWKNGDVKDCGWRRWQADKFIGGGELPWAVQA